MDNELQKLVLQYVPLANKLAYQKKRNLPSFIDVEELKSAAYLGLVEAASRYNPEVGVAFSTFAYRRVFGAICDYLRELGWGPKTSQMENCDMLEGEPERNDSFLEVVSADLNDQAKQILRLYFVENYSMKEVGNKFSISESRVSQLIKYYKQRIRDRWDERDLRIMLAA